MKITFLKRLVILLTILAMVQLAHAQAKDFSNSVTIGITTPILDQGAGIYLGVNPAVLFSPRFAVEGQLSYMHTKIKSSFLSGKEGTVNSVNILLGARLYILSQVKPTRLYINALLGGNYNREQQEQFKFENHQLGFSGGVFLALQRFLIGLSLESPENIVLQAGYVF